MSAIIVTARESLMSFRVLLESADSIVVVYIDRALTLSDQFVVEETIRELSEDKALPVLLDFRSLKEPISDIARWVSFVDHLRSVDDRRIALLNTMVGQATTCSLIALWANGREEHTQAFQKEAVARKWLAGT